MAEIQYKLTNEEVLQLFDEQLPEILEAYPELEPRIYHAFLKAFVRKEEFAFIETEVREFRAETRANFERVDQRLGGLDSQMGGLDSRMDGLDTRMDGLDTRMDGLDTRMDGLDTRMDGLDTRMDRVEDALQNLHRAITGLGARWGIYNEDVIRQMIASLLEENYGAKVDRLVIDGEEFDVVITNGEHILIEVTARAKSNVQQRLERKRALYIEKTGQTPDRVILAVGSIYSTRAQALREVGFEVIEPSEDLEEWS